MELGAKKLYKYFLDSAASHLAARTNTPKSKVVSSLYGHFNMTLVPANARTLLLWSGCSLDMLGHHAASCKHGGDMVARHNHLRNIFAAFFRHAHLLAKVEVGMG